KSVRECEKTLFELTESSTATQVQTQTQAPPKAPTPPRNLKRRCTSRHTRLHLSLPDATVEKLDRVQALTKQYDLAKLIDHCLDLAIQAHDPSLKKSRQSKGSQNRRTIPAAAKKALYLRSSGRCE